MLFSLPRIAFPNPQGFVVLEGVNGAGKSTLQRRLIAYLQERGLEAVSTFEPGATELGVGLRRLLLENKSEAIHPETELLLFSADRREHVAKVIKPALERKNFVVCDRYFYSTTAFQGYGRGLNLAAVEEVNRLATGQLQPDLVILLDLDPLEGLKRGRARDQGTANSDSFESEELAFHERLRAGFLEMAKHRPEPFLVLDAGAGRDQVFAAAKEVLDVIIGKLTNGH